MKKHRRALEAILACALAAILLFSVFYIALEAGHDCSGEDCVICAVLRVCENLLRQLLGAGAAAAAMLLVTAVVFSLREQHFRRPGCFTLIILKVKLSD